MKILFITFFFPPYKTVASIRTGKTAKLLYNMGHDIKIVSAKNDDLQEELKIEIPEQNLYQTDWFDLDKAILDFLGKDKNTTKDMLHNGENKKSFRSKVIDYLFKIYRYFFYTPDKYIGWYKYGLKESEKILKDWKPDIIFASGTPYTGFMIASKLSKKYDIPFVADLRDLWSDNHSHKQYTVGKYLEYRTLNAASSLISVSKPLVEKLQKKYPNIPCYEVRNAFDESDFYKQETVKNDKISILYTGMMYPKKQDPTLLFEIISQNEELKNKLNINFYGNSLEWIIELAKKHDVESVVNVNLAIERKKVLKLQAQSDILLLFIWNDKNEKGIFTGKIFEYIGSAKPILAIGENSGDVVTSTIRENNFGLVSNNQNEITEFILSITESENVIKYNKAYENNRFKFEREHQIKKLVKIFEKVIKR